MLSGSKIAERLRAWRDYQVFDVRGEDGKTVAERVRESGEEVPTLPEMGFDDDFLADPCVGVIYDEREGLSFYRNFAIVAETFERPELVHDRRNRETVLRYLEDDSISPLPLRRLAERDSDHAPRVFRDVLKQRDFDWKSDAEALFRRFKPWFYEQPVVPSVVVVDRNGLKQRIAAVTPPALEFARIPGRNEPCACGSGKKYKKCCGK